MAAVDAKQLVTGRGAGSGVVPLGLINSFLAEQRRGLTEKQQTVNKVFPRNDKLVTADEAWLVLVLKHVMTVRAALFVV